MPTLYNYQTNKWEFVDEANTQSAVASGNYQFAAAKKVPAINPAGEAVEIPATEATEAFRNGYQFRTDNLSKQYINAAIEEHRRQIAEETPGAAFSAAGLGALSGATFSGSDWLLKAIGPEGTPEALRDLQAAHPVATTLGEIGGALIGGPMGLLNRASTRVAGQVGAQAASAIAGQSANAARIAAGLKLGGTAAVESALFETGRISKDLAQENPDLTAQNAIARLGLASVLGGGAGFGLGYLGKAAGQVGDAIKASWAKRGSIALGDKTADAVTEAFAFGRGWGEAEKASFKRTLRDPAWRDKVVAALEEPEQIAAKAKGSLEAFKASADDMMDALQVFKQRRVKEGPEAAQAIKGEEMDWIRLKRRIGQNFPKYEKESALYGTGTREALEQTIAKIDELMAPALTKSEAHAAVSAGREFLDKVISAKGGFGGVTNANLKELKIWRGELKKHLENPQLYGGMGKDYGAAQAGFNRFLEPYSKVFGKDNKPGLLTTKQVDRSGNPILVLDEGKVQRLLHSPTRNAKNRETWRQLNRLFDATSELSATVAKQSRGIGGPQAQIDEFEKALGNKLGQVKQIREQLLEFKAARDASIFIGAAQPTTGRVLQAPVIGGLAAGPVGAVAGMVYSNPMKMLQVMSNVQTAQSATMGNIRAAASKFLSPVRAGLRTAKQPALKTMSVSLAQLGDSLGMPERRGEPKLNRISRGLATLANDPMLVEQNVKRSLPGMDDFGPLYSSVLNTTQRAVKFLNAKFPAMQFDVLQVRDIELSPSAEARLLAYANAVMKPNSILQQLEDGTLQRETVEAVKAVYPDFYAQIQSEVVGMLAARPRSLDYYRRLQLGILFEIPATQGMQNVAMLQQAFAPVQPRPPSQQSTARSKFAPAEATPGQTLEQREVMA